MPGFAANTRGTYDSRYSAHGRVLHHWDRDPVGAHGGLVGVPDMNQDCSNCVFASVVIRDEQIVCTACRSGKLHVKWLRRDPARMRPKKHTEFFTLRDAWPLCLGFVDYWEHRPAGKPPVRQVIA